MKREGREFKVSIIPSEEIESGNYFKLDAVRKRNLSNFMQSVIEDFEMKTEITVNGIEIQRNGKRIVDIKIL